MLQQSTIQYYTVNSLALPYQNQNSQAMKKGVAEIKRSDQEMAAIISSL